MSSYWARFSRRPLSRRSMLRGAAAGAAAAGAAYAFGCGGREDGAADASPTREPRADGPDILNAAGPPRRGGRFAFAEAAPFGSFDPHLGLSLASSLFPRLYNVLVNQCATRPGFIHHDLAASYETPDDRTYIFHIRPGVAIAPNDLGVPERDIDGDDVRVSLERIIGEPAANNHSFAKDNIDSIYVTGDMVTIRTRAPYAWFLNRIGLFVNTIAPRELLAGNVDRLATAAAGGGPFRLIKVVDGESARLDRNPNYYRRDETSGAQLPHVDGLDVQIMFDRSAQRTAFLDGQTLRYRPGTGDEARGLERDFIVTSDPQFSFVAFAMNPRRAPFGDERVRRAFSRAIDRRQYVDVVYKGDAQANGLVHWPLGDYALPADELRRLQPFDIEEARQLLSAAGVDRIRMMYPTGTPLMEHSLHLPIFLEQMRALGVEVDQQPQELGTWIENYRTLNYDCSLALNQFYETPEIPLDFHTSNGALGDKTYIVGLGDPEIDAAVLRTKRLIDLDERIAAVHEAQRIIYAKDPVVLPLVSPYEYEAWRPTVKNIPAGVGTTKFLLDTYWIDA